MIAVDQSRFTPRGSGGVELLLSHVPVRNLKIGVALAKRKGLSLRYTIVASTKV